MWLSVCGMVAQKLFCLVDDLKHCVLSQFAALAEMFGNASRWFLPSYWTIWMKDATKPLWCPMADLTCTRVFADSIGCVTQYVKPANMPHRNTSREPGKQVEFCQCWNWKTESVCGWKFLGHSHWSHQGRHGTRISKFHSGFLWAIWISDASSGKNNSREVHVCGFHWPRISLRLRRLMDDLASS